MNDNLQKPDAKIYGWPILMLLQWKHRVTDHVELEPEQLTYSIINTRMTGRYIVHRNNKFVLDIKLAIC